MFRSFLSGFNIIDWLYNTICMLPAVIIGLSMHEFAHAKVAELCGDPTPRLMGRVTIDPRAHINPYGLIALIIVHFGWGQPVMINPSYFRHRKADTFLVSIAGVTMNCIIALAFGLMLRYAIRSSLYDFFLTPTGDIVWSILSYIVVINFGLMLFNLLPVPPLDGFNAITTLFNLNPKIAYKNSMIILILLILFDVPSYLLVRPLNFLINHLIFL